MGWLEEFFGVELGMVLKFLIAFAILLCVAFLALWAVRRISGRADLAAGGRGRQPRLGVLEAMAVDQRRRLVLVRRDNVEHLILIGGPADLVVESSIVRSAPGRVAREEAARTAPQRQVAGPRPAVARQPAEHEAAPGRAEPTPQPPERPAAPPAAAAERPAEAPRRRAEPRPEQRPENGIAAAAGALEQALRRPFGAGRGAAPPMGEEPEPEEGADRNRAEPQRPSAEPRAQRSEPAPGVPFSNTARTPERSRSEARLVEDEPAEESREPLEANAPRFLSEAARARAGAQSSGSAGGGQRRERDEAGEPRRDPPRPRQAAPRPAPAPQAERAAPPPGPGPRAVAGQGESFAPALREARSPDIVVSRSDRPAPLSLEDEMASLLDEIAGTRDRP